MKNYVMGTYLYAFLFGFFDRLLWGDGFGYSHDTDDAWSEWYDTGANWADKLLERAESGTSGRGLRRVYLRVRM